MKVLLILSAILGATLAYPHVAYMSHRAHQAPAIPSAYAVVAPSIPVASTNIYAPAAPPIVNVPVITGNLYHSQDTLGQYEFGYSSSDGQAKEEKKSSEGEISGHFSYTAPEGNDIKLSYTAGAAGFQAEGDHLPESVELPEELKQAYQEANERLEKAHEEARLRGETEEDDGSWSEEKHGDQATAQGPQHGYGPVQGPSYQALLPSIPVNQHVQYAVAAPAPVKSSGHYASAVPSIQYAAPAAPKVQYAVVQSAPVQSHVGYAAPAPAPVHSHVGYAAPASAPVQEVEAPAPYLKSSYQTEIGGPVAQHHVIQSPVPVHVQAPAPVAPSHYGKSQSHY